MNNNNNIFKLYSFFYSSASWRVRIALNLKNIKYEYVGINLTKGEQYNEEYRKINPTNAVPALLHNDKLLIESTAIIEYLDALYPQINPFLTNDIYDQAQIRSISQIVNSGMQPMQNLRVAKHIEQEYKGNRENWTLHWVEKGYKSLEDILQRTSGLYCFGNKISQADIFIYPQAIANVRRLNYDLKKHPAVFKVISNLEQVVEFEQSEPQHQPDFKQ